MIESTVVFTHYALLLTAATFLLIGTLLGWAIVGYFKKKKISGLKSQLKTLHGNLAEKSVDADTVYGDAKPPIPAIADSSSLHKKKDRLLKDFMKKQLKQKKLLDKANAEIKELQQAKLQAEKSLSAAHTSLDQWKEKCVALAQARTKNKTTGAAVAQTRQSQPSVSAESQKSQARVVTSTAATFKVPAISISNAANQRVNAPAASPIRKAAQTEENAMANPAKTQSPETPVNESLAAEVLTPVKKGTGKKNVQETENSQTSAPKSTKSRKPAGKATKLTNINGIGPAIEKELKKLGIKSVEQLALLDPEAAGQIDKDLGKYSGRINRQGWVEQAQKLTISENLESAAA